MEKVATKKMTQNTTTESIYWYDLETTGTNQYRDRVLQFAGIRTDYDLNIIAEPQNIFCRPGNDVLPAPGALVVNGISMQNILAHGDIERDFTQKIAAELNTASSCIVGYNNLRFDDEFIRNIFYRNFHDPYVREWRNDNSRWDLIDICRAAYALRPDGLHWPDRAASPGVPSFKLEDLAKANNIEHGQAHDALADVRATIALAKIIKTKQPRLYDYLFQLRRKQAVLKLLYPLGKSAVLHVSSKYPATRGCAAIVLPLCQHPVNRNSIICFDLGTSPESLLSTPPDALAQLIFTASSKLPAGQERIALKEIHINRCPVVVPLKTLGDTDAERLGLDKALSQERMHALQRSSGLVEKIQDVYDKDFAQGSDDPDLMLYSGGFFNDADKQVMTEILHASPKELSGYHGRFHDKRLDEMLFRYRARNFISSLDTEEIKKWNTYRWSNWEDGEHITQVLAGIEKSRNHLAQEKGKDKTPAEQQHSMQVLDDLEQYIKQLLADLPAAQQL